MFAVECGVMIEIWNCLKFRPIEGWASVENFDSQLLAAEIIHFDDGLEDTD